MAQDTSRAGKIATVIVLALGTAAFLFAPSGEEVERGYKERYRRERGLEGVRRPRRRRARA